MEIIEVKEFLQNQIFRCDYDVKTIEKLDICTQENPYVQKRKTEIIAEKHAYEKVLMFII